MDAQLISWLEDPQRFHYKDLWLAEENPARRDVLELFAFGTLQDAPSGMELTTPMVTKLQKLTIISLSEHFRELSYVEIQRKCHIDEIGTLEELLIQLRTFFEVRLDSVRQVATIGRLYDCRDVYADERPLQVVKNLPTTSDTLLQDLRRWKRKLQVEILGE